MTKQELISRGIDMLTESKREQQRLTGWFVYQEIKMQVRQELSASGKDPDVPDNQAEILCECVSRMPLSIPSGSVFAGTQDDAFSPSYALINPAFKVETFAGYCDPLAVYDDIAPDAEFPAERIEKVRVYYAETNYVKELYSAYRQTGGATREVVYFVEPVTGHIIPDLRPVLRDGIAALSAGDGYRGVIRGSMQAAVILAGRYYDLAKKMITCCEDPAEVSRLNMIARACKQVPEFRVRNLHEAMQSFVLLWQVMCLEQAPNPYAFSVGNLDRILAPYLFDTPHDEAVALVRHLLAFFMVGDRGWAISQNLMVGGMDQAGNDLTNPMSYIILDAFFESNQPQPALSVKLHSGTPQELYDALGKFFFTPGKLTPSLFNDEAMFAMLKDKGVAENDLPDYSIAGCQEPLIMGRENGNTTNSWLNLGKVLELTLNDGCSLLSGEKLGLSWQELGYNGISDVLENLETAFFKQLDMVCLDMREAANACTETLGKVAAPFTSSLMGGLESGRDCRNPEQPGTRYGGSGCLIHGLSVLADSLTAVKALLKHEIASPEQLIEALRDNFQGHEQLKTFLSSQDKYGNNFTEVDNLTAVLADRVCERISALTNSAGKPFCPDFSTPSTHLLYGYWVGATPDGRGSREMLGYGIDPRPGVAVKGLQERMLSNQKLPFGKMTGGYASHLGLSPNDFSKYHTMKDKIVLMAENVIKPLFGFCEGKTGKISPFYVYFNVDQAGHLRKVLADPEKYAPNGIYILRIHGTFVNFLDLSPAIQEDIIARLDPESTILV